MEEDSNQLDEFLGKCKEKLDKAKEIIAVLSEAKEEMTEPLDNPKKVAADMKQMIQEAKDQNEIDETQVRATKIPSLTTCYSYSCCKVILGMTPPYLYMYKKINFAGQKFNFSSRSRIYF